MTHSYQSITLVLRKVVEIQYFLRVLRSAMMGIKIIMMVAHHHALSSQDGFATYPIIKVSATPVNL
jgi:hypothetical protein